jgi:chaperone BCS1
MITLPGAEFVSGGALLIIFGAVLAYFRNIPSKIYNLLERCFIIRIDIQEEDESFSWLKLWLSSQLKGTLSVSVFTQNSSDTPNWEEPCISGASLNRLKAFPGELSDRKPRVIFTPAPGWYIFRYKSRFVTVNRNRTEPEGKGGDTPLRPRESFTMRMFSRNLDLAKKMIEEARDFTLPCDGKIEVRTCGMGHYWALTGRIRPRPIESVILDGDIAERLVSSVRTFQKSGDWYTTLGVPYRKTFLLYGPPGSGKTSSVIGVASALGMNINILNLSTPGMSDGKVIELLSQVDINTLTLIEDVDCSFVKRNSGPDRKGKIDAGLTFSGVLNALDGVLGHDGRIVFMTTNHPEMLDDALTREGRMDEKYFIDHASRDQIARIYRRFFPETSIDQAKRFAAGLPDKVISMAKVQHHLMKYRADADGAISNLSDLLKKEEYEKATTPIERAGQKDR